MVVYNLQGISDRKNILWTIVLHALYKAQRQPSGIGYIIGHLNWELLLYIHALSYVKGILRGHCSAECVDGCII